MHGRDIYTCRYEEQARLDKARYEQEMASYTPPNTWPQNMLPPPPPRGGQIGIIAPHQLPAGHQVLVAKSMHQVVR